MAASVRIEDEAFSDPRYDVLAKLCLLADADHARGKMAVLWRQCTARGGYVLPASIVVAVLGDLGASALAESTLGEVVSTGVRICGTRGRIEWLKKLRKNAKKGGDAKAAKRQEVGRTEASKSLPPPFPPTPTLTLTKEEQERPASPPLVLEQLKAKVDKATSGHQAVIAEFTARYRAAYGADPSWSKWSAQVKALLKSHSADEIRRRIAILFTSPPSWLQGPYDFGTLVQHFDKLVQPTKQTANGRPPEPPRTNLLPL